MRLIQVIIPKSKYLGAHQKAQISQIESSHRAESTVSDDRCVEDQILHPKTQDLTGERVSYGHRSILRVIM